MRGCCYSRGPASAALAIACTVPEAPCLQTLPFACPTYAGESQPTCGAIRRATPDRALAARAALRRAAARHAGEKHREVHEVRHRCCARRKLSVRQGECHPVGEAAQRAHPSQDWSNCVARKAKVRNTRHKLTKVALQCATQGSLTTVICLSLACAYAKHTRFGG